MSKRKQQREEEAAEGEDVGDRARLMEKPEMPNLPDQKTVKLRLRTNSMLGLEGVFTKAGTIQEFPKAEAERLLQKTELWEIA